MFNDYLASQLIEPARTLLRVIAKVAISKAVVPSIVILFE